MRNAWKTGLIGISYDEFDLKIVDFGGQSPTKINGVNKTINK